VKTLRTERTTFALSLIAFISLTSLEAQAAGEVAVPYPAAHRGDVVDNLHGTAVADPYRWLEDLDSAESKNWIGAQAKLADAYLATIPERATVRSRLQTLWDYEKISAPRKRGGRIFYSRNTGLQNQSALYWHEDKKGELPVVLLDPNTLSDDGTVALSGTALSDDGKHLAYGLSSSGSDWQEWRVREVATGKDLDDHIRWVKFSGASWSPDGQGFCYSRYDAPDEGAALKQANYFQKVYYHRLGTPQDEDILVYEQKDHKEWGFDADFSEDGAFLIMGVWPGAASKNAIFYRRESDQAAPFVQLFDQFDATYTFLGNDGDTFYIKTDKGAPNGRVVAVDLANPDPEHWRTVIPESEDTLRSASLFDDEMIVSFLQDAKTRISVYALADGKKIRDITLPGIGSVYGFGGKRDSSETFYTFTSFVEPGAIYRYTVGTGETQLYRKPKVDFDPADYVVRQEFVTSKDGTEIPVFLCHRKDLPEGVAHPTYQYGYGGFRISITPRFSVSNLVWMESGGVLVHVVLRGGGEYGESWHEAGMRSNKQNVFDDFIAVSEWLITQGITSSEKLAIAGGSNGGLLVGACLTQRPELYRACLPAVGVLDMLRFHKFTIGWAWQDEYGYPDKEKDFRTLYRYSPYHNLKKGTRYPATLILTADHDDRVFPAHSFKFAAALQHAHAGGTPALIRIEQKAGHGAGKPTSKRIDEASDRWAFLIRELGVKLP